MTHLRGANGVQATREHALGSRLVLTGASGFHSRQGNNGSMPWALGQFRLVLAGFILVWAIARAHPGLSAGFDWCQRVHSRQDEASDDGEQGPIPLEHGQGAIRRQPRQETQVCELSLPFSRCENCAAAGVGEYMALTVRDEARHMEESHPHLNIRYKCKWCGKSYASYRATACHLPKCPAARANEGQRTVEQGRFDCPDCDRNFVTQRGLSQHQRLAHPVARNRVRSEQAAPKVELKRGRVFSAEDVSRMLELKVELRDEKNIAKAMVPFMPEKTLRQIKDKRNEACYKRWREQRLESARSKQELLNEKNQQVDGAPLEVDDVFVDAEEIEDVFLDVEEAPCDIYSFDESASTVCWRQANIEAVLKELRENEPKESLEVQQHIIQLLTAKSESQAITQEELDTAYELAVSLFHAPAPGKAGGASRGHRSHRKGFTGRSERKARAYARTQELYRNNPAILAKMVREGMDVRALDAGESANPSVESVKELYEGLWGSPGQCDIDQREREATVPYNPAEILHPISKTEILKRFRSTRLRVAAGPNGLRKGDLMRNEGGYILHAIFNVIMLALKQPSAWRCNRTTLLLKEGKDLSVAANYRPITISSILSRSYWGIMDQRLRNVVHLNARQKGFVPEMGCYNNINLLNEVLAMAKKGKGIVATQVDIAKAFDSLPHPVIKYALLGKGLPKEVVALIMDSYKGAKTTMKCHNETFDIELKSGVKQGDPLSPFIFNVCMDLIIDRLERMEGFQVKEGLSISCLAFADDIILIADTREAASRLMDKLVGSLTRWGMALSIGKFVAFSIVTTKDSWYITALKLRANVAANKVSQTRIAKTNSVMCRKCKAQPETLGHILGQCVYTKSGSIKRHNDIRNFIERHVLGQRGMVVTKEA
ncbi:uncharacterized protein [Temnothorax longispinosus]|uniref:uncharacterized protein n=1 Tax=Temnothorax longispinosus TaxID=300112 RepID=UPI003A9A0921